MIVRFLYLLLFSIYICLSIKSTAGKCSLFNCCSLVFMYTAAGFATILEVFTFSYFIVLKEKSYRNIIVCSPIPICGFNN